LKIEEKSTIPYLNLKIYIIKVRKINLNGVKVRNEWPYYCHMGLIVKILLK